MRLLRIHPSTSLGFLIVGAIAGSRASGQCGELQMLTASDGTASDYYGVDVDIDGDVAVVGATGDDPDGSSSGSVYVYRFDPAAGQWMEEQKLTAGTSGAAGDDFGRAVTVSGNVIAIGAQLDNDDSNPAITDKGSVYVYRYDPNSKSWVLEKKITASNGSAGDRFGLGIDVDGDLLAIGAFLDDDCEPDSGSVYVFRYSGPVLSWLNETQLQGSCCSADDQLGYDVGVRRDDVLGDVVVAGAPHDDPLGTNSGSAYVFRRDTITKSWSKGQKLTPAGGQGLDVFGFSVAIDEFIVVGAYKDDNPSGTVDVGSANVFGYDESSGQWIEIAKLDPIDPNQSDWFGTSVGTSGDVIVVGAQLDDLTFVDAGSATVFRRCGDTWVADEMLAPRTRGTSDWFGFSAAVSGDRAICGAYLDDTNKGVDSGAAYIYGAGEIGLMMTPTTVMPGALMNVSMFYGEPGDPVLFVAVSLNGGPIFDPLFLATFGGDHTLTFSSNVPSSVSGITVGFQAYEIDACGHITGSNIVYVIFQC